MLYEGGPFRPPRKALTFWRGDGGLHEDGSRSRPRADSARLKEFRTLEFMIKNARRAISRDELLKEVWGYENYPCIHTVDNHILKLRQKLENDPANPAHLVTMHGLGYKFIP
jgi:DNA-binding response OmpR family regulator